MGLAPQSGAPDPSAFPWCVVVISGFLASSGGSGVGEGLGLVVGASPGLTMTASVGVVWPGSRGSCRCRRPTSDGLAVHPLGWEWILSAKK